MTTRGLRRLFNEVLRARRGWEAGVVAVRAQDDRDFRGEGASFGEVPRAQRGWEATGVGEIACGQVEAKGAAPVKGATTGGLAAAGEIARRHASRQARSYGGERV